MQNIFKKFIKKYKKDFSLIFFMFFFSIGVIIFMFYNYPIQIRENILAKDFTYRIYRRFFFKFNIFFGFYLDFFIVGILFFLHYAGVLEDLPNYKNFYKWLKKKR